MSLPRGKSQRQPRDHGKQKKGRSPPHLLQRRFEVAPLFNLKILISRNRRTRPISLSKTNLLLLLLLLSYHLNPTIPLMPSSRTSEESKRASRKLKASLTRPLERSKQLLQRSSNLKKKSRQPLILTKRTDSATKRSSFATKRIYCSLAWLTKRSNSATKRSNCATKRSNSARRKSNYAIALLKRKNKLRFKYPIVATAAGSGTGKTRFCDELAAKLTNPDNPSDEKILAIPISYNGFTDLRFSNISSNELALRILFMSFFSFSGPNLAGDWKKFGSLFQTSTRSLDGCTIIDAIFQYSGASRAVLLIDEISKSLDESATLNYAEGLVNENSGRPQTLRLFITALDARFQRNSSRPIEFIQLYLLQNEHLMTHLFPGSTPLQQILIKLACGHPRLLEEIDRYFKANEHNPPTSLATSLANINYNRLKFLSSLSQVRVALLGGQTTSNESLGLLRESIFMDPDRQSDLYLGEAPYSPQMPLLPLLQWTHRHSNEPTFKIIYRMITTLTDQINLTTNSGPGGKPYEVFHALWEVMVRQLIRLKPSDPAFPVQRPYEDHYKISSMDN